MKTGLAIVGAALLLTGCQSGINAEVDSFPPKVRFNTPLPVLAEPPVVQTQTEALRACNDFEPPRKYDGDDAHWDWCDCMEDQDAGSKTRRFVETCRAPVEQPPSQVEPQQCPEAEACPSADELLAPHLDRHMNDVQGLGRRIAAYETMEQAVCPIIQALPSCEEPGKMPKTGGYDYWKAFGNDVTCDDIAEAKRQCGNE